MRDFRAITVFPSLQPSPPEEVRIGRWTIRPYPWAEHDEAPELAAHLNRILRSTNRTCPLFFLVREFENEDEFWKDEKELVRACLPFTYCVLAKAAETGAIALTAEHADIYSFRHVRTDSAESAYGYDVVRNGAHAGFCRDSWELTSIPSSAAANYDTETYDWLREQQDNERVLSALNWFMKSCRRDADDLDQVIALSVAFEALLDLPNSKNGAAFKLRRILQDSGVEHAREIAKKVRDSGLLVSFVSRRFRSRIKRITNSDKISGYAKDFYNVGSGIRHGNPLFRGQVSWHGRFRHLYRPGFGRRLFVFVLRELFGKPGAGDRGKAKWDASRLVDREQMERMLGSDRERFDEIQRLLASDESNEEKLSGLLQISDFLRDGSIGQDRAQDFLAALKTTIGLAQKADGARLADLAEEMTDVLGIKAGTPNFNVGKTCHALYHKAINSSLWTPGMMAVFNMAYYCAHLHDYG